MTLLPGLARAGDQADQRFAEGMTFVQQGRYEEARQAFLQAYALHATQPVLWNLAVSELKTGRTVDALRHMKQYLRGAPTDPKYVQIAPSLLDKMNAETCHVQVEAPAGADILVDGVRLVDRAPLPDTADVAPGEHVVEARLGDKSARTSVKCGAGEKVPAVVAFAAGGGEKPGATVAAGEKPGAGAGEKPGAGTGAGAGAGEKSGSTAKVATVAGLGVVGVTGVVVGAVFLGGLGSKEDEAKGLVAQEGGTCVGKTSANCARVAQLKSDYDGDRTLGLVFLGAGAALTAGAAITYFVWPSGSGKQGALRPMVGIDRVGLAGSF